MYKIKLIYFKGYILYFILLSDIVLDSVLLINFKLSFDVRYKCCFFDKNNDDIKDFIYILLFKIWNVLKIDIGKCGI